MVEMIMFDGLKLKVPSGWQGEAMYTLSASTGTSTSAGGGGARLTVTVLRSPRASSQSALTFAQSQLQAIRGRLPEFLLREDVARGLIARECVVYEFSYAVPRTGAMVQRVYVLTDSAWFYLFTFAALSDAFDREAAAALIRYMRGLGKSDH